VIGVGEPHENGDVESAHGHLRTAIDQALRLRGSRRFENVAEYESLYFHMVRARNATRKERFRHRVGGAAALGSNALARVRRSGGQG